MNIKGYRHFPLSASLSLAVLLIAMCVFQDNARAQELPALTFQGEGGNGTSIDSTRGYAFDVSASGGVFVTGLTVYDQGGNGLAEAHQVGLWNSSGLLLASVTVPAGTAAPLDGSGVFREVTLSLPLFLAAGTNYAVGALFMTGSTDLQAINWTSSSTASGIQYVESRFINGPATLTFPTSTGAFLGLPGGSFDISAVPEPQTWILLGAGVLLMIWQSAKRRARQS